MIQPTNTIWSKAGTLVTLGIILVVAFVGPARANTYYVATNGDDTNPGSPGSPFKTIEKAIAKAEAGDTVSIAAGNYTYETTPIVLSNSGTSSKPITFAAGAGTYIYAPLLATNKCYITLVGFQTQNYGAYDGIKFTTCHNMIINAMTMYNLWSGNGINLQGCASVTITNCGCYSITGNAINCKSCANTVIASGIVQAIAGGEGAWFDTCTNAIISSLDVQSVTGITNYAAVYFVNCDVLTVSNCAVSQITNSDGFGFVSCANMEVLSDSVTNVSGGAGLYFLGSSFATVSNCFISHTSESGIGVWGVPWGVDPGASYPAGNINISYCTVDRACDGGRNECISIANGVIQSSVSYCLITDSSPVDGTYGGEGLDVKLAAYNIWIEHNEIYNIQRTGVMFDAAVQYERNWTPAGLHHIYFSDNAVHNVPGNGVTLEAEYYGLGIVGPLELIEVHDNLIYSNAANGIWVANYQYTNTIPVQNPVFTNIWLCNNTLFNNVIGSGGSSGIGIDANPNLDAPHVYDNIIDEPSGWPIGAAPVSGCNWAWVDYNLVSGGGAWNWVANYQDTNHFWNNAYTGDPMFANTATPDFHLTPGSPAIGKGWVTGIPGGGTAFDFDGYGRPTNGVTDVGAYEHH